jgi:endonuclease YncB( thermonuclease family)
LRSYAYCAGIDRIAAALFAVAVFILPVLALLQVRESTGTQQQKQSPYIEELLKAQEAAQGANLGLWNKVRPCASSSTGQPRQSA